MVALNLTITMHQLHLAERSFRLISLSEHDTHRHFVKCNDGLNMERSQNSCVPVVTRVRIEQRSKCFADERDITRWVAEDEVGAEHTTHWVASNDQVILPGTREEKEGKRPCRSLNATPDVPCRCRP